MIQKIGVLDTRKTNTPFLVLHVQFGDENLTHRSDESQSYDSRYITDDHEGIVSRELWDKVQEMRESRRQELNVGIHRKKSCHPLYGKVFCGTCDRPCCRRIVRNHDGSKEATWVCVDRVKGSKGEGCRNLIAKERHILKAMWEKTGSEISALEERIVLKEDYGIIVLVP